MSPRCLLAMVALAAATAAGLRVHNLRCGDAEFPCRNNDDCIGQFASECEACADRDGTGWKCWAATRPPSPPPAAGPVRTTCGKARCQTDDDCMSLFGTAWCGACYDRDGTGLKCWPPPTWHRK